MNGGKTVEGIDGLRIITHGATGQQFEELQNYMMMLEHKDNVIESALELRAIDSSSPLSLAMDRQVAKLLRLPLNEYDDPMAADLSGAQKEAVTAIYDVTQRILSIRGISHVVVYRGLSWQERPEWMDQSLLVGQSLLLVGHEHYQAGL